MPCCAAWSSLGCAAAWSTDWIGQPGREDALRAVLAAAEEYFMEEGTDLVACLVHGDERAARMLRRNGFLRAPKRAFKEWYFGVRSTKIRWTLPCSPILTTGT